MAVFRRDSYNFIRDCLRYAPGALASYLNSNTGWQVLMVGGNWNNGSNAGLFYFNANNTSSNTSSNIGARHLDCNPIIAQAFPHRLVKILPHRTGLSRFILDQPCRQTRTEVLTMPKKIGFLYDKMSDRKFIRGVILDAAHGRHSRSDVAPILEDLDGYVELTYEMVVTESFVPSKPKEKDIFDESSQKWRKIKMVPFWPDGIMHWLLVSAMKPVLMRGMYHWSCASLPGRGNKRVHGRIKSAMRNDPKGTKYAAELDVAQYYPSISINKLIWALARKIKDKKFLRVVYSVLETCGGGLAIGYYICQWLANYYLEPLDQFIMTLPGVKYMTRHMDNITLLGPSKKDLHKAVKAIRDFMRQRLSLILKGNWQVYRTTFTPAVEKRHRLLDEKKRRQRKPRMVSAVGYRFSHEHIVLRKRNFLRFSRQCRRAKKRLDTGKPIAYIQASGLLSRIGQLKHCNSHNIRVKYVDPIGVRNLKEVVRYESKRRLAAQCGLYAGGAA